MHWCSWHLSSENLGGGILCVCRMNDMNSVRAEFATLCFSHGRKVTITLGNTELGV